MSALWERYLAAGTKMANDDPQFFRRFVEIAECIADPDATNDDAIARILADAMALHDEGGAHVW